MIQCFVVEQVFVQLKHVVLFADITLHVQYVICKTKEPKMDYILYEYN